MSGKIAVLGAGIIGVCCAVELQRRGYDVTLIDKNAPGEETSYGNAGVIARSSIIPFNHPGLWKSLPKLMGNKSTSFRYDPTFVAANMNWTAGFLKRANLKDFNYTTQALDDLIQLSTRKHEEMASILGIADKLNRKGWLHLYRQKATFDKSKLIRNTFDKFNVATKELNSDQISNLEPDLAPIFAKGLWIQDTMSFQNPGDLVKAYAAYFTSHGGILTKAKIQNLEKSGDGYKLTLDKTTHSKNTIIVDQVVVALGPWAKTFLKKFGYRVPLVFERGYHMNFSHDKERKLNRPVYDIDGGYVLAPMSNGVRLTTGVELAQQNSSPNYSQLAAAEAGARDAFPLNKPMDSEPWLGSRPTLPDCRPIIGQAPRHNGLWLAIGHQHIGFSTGPGTASILGSLISEEASPINAEPFRAERFIT
ncbi:NAD(P)/FAD-dependent oxidoreductase [Kiloniella antarctica]|uniref:NAD(P)/FAD-dependent oxidoreductase n=1 Tax=Kiloniella antarctica TaxID=1550907 RepID=A0ABW5BL19_9PROT